MKICYRNQNYTFAVVVVMIIIIALSGISVVDAAIIEKDQITMGSDMNATVTNESGETITVTKNKGLSGTMEILEEKWTLTNPIDYELTVRSSNSYTYEKTGKGNSTVALIHKEDVGDMVMISFEDVGTAKVVFEPEGRIEVKGPPQKYMIHVLNDAGIYEFEGSLHNEITVEEKGNHIVVNGVSGKTRVSIETPNFKKHSEGTYYIFGGSTILGCTDKGPYITNAARIPDRLAKSPESIYLRPVNNGNNMFLTWEKVKKAKSYIVYRYDSKNRRYKREAVRNGQGANYYIIDSNQKGIYRYKILARSGKNGTGKNIGKLSYYVSSVTDSSSKGNVAETKIRSAKKTLTIKKGKKKKLNAVVYGNGKPLYNKSIRWYSSNDKVAKINNKTGKIKAKKKGSCYVWAKAHNGKNSSRIKIVVK